MKFGLLFALRSLEPSARNRAEVYYDMLEQVRIAEDLGFDSVWISEHHLVPDGYCPSPIVAAAAAAARTTSITVGIRVLLLPLYDPLKVAEDIAVADLISGGRFVLGAGIGYRNEEFRAFGVDRGQRGSIMDEQLQVLKLAWTEDRFSFSGRHYQYDDVSVYPKPARQPHPPLWLAGRGGKAIDRAARLGDGFHGVGEPEVFEAFAAAMQRHGRDPYSIPIAESRQCWVAETDEAAWRQARPGVTHVLMKYSQWFAESADLPQDLAPALDPDSIPDREFIGSPQRVIDKYQEQMERLPHLSHTIMHVPPGIPHDMVVQHLELFSSQVMPALS